MSSVFALFFPISIFSFFLFLRSAPGWNFTIFSLSSLIPFTFLWLFLLYEFSSLSLRSLFDPFHRPHRPPQNYAIQGFSPLKQSCVCVSLKLHEQLRHCCCLQSQSSLLLEGLRDSLSNSTKISERVRESLREKTSSITRRRRLITVWCGRMANSLCVFSLPSDELEFGIQQGVKVQH